MNPEADYDGGKRRAAAGIVVWAIILALAFSTSLAGWFFFLDASGQVIKARRSERWFDQWADVPDRQGSYKCWEMTGLSEEFAMDVETASHYYFAFDSSWNPLIVKMKGERKAAFQPYRDVVYVEGARIPEPFMLRGVSAPIEEDIRKYAIENLNALFDGEVISEDDFEELMGVNFLDTTQKPVGNANFGAALGLGMSGAVFCVAGMCFLIRNVMRWRNLESAQMASGYHISYGEGMTRAYDGTADD